MASCETTETWLYMNIMTGILRLELEPSSPTSSVLSSCSIEIPKTVNFNNRVQVRETFGDEYDRTPIDVDKITFADALLVMQMKKEFLLEQRRNGQ